MSQQELYATLEEVTAQHLIADVPVGLLLSGGLDLSLIAALAARRAPSPWALPIRTSTSVPRPAVLPDTSVREHEEI